MDSYGSCYGGNVQHAVYVIERDFVYVGSAATLYGDYVTDTLCVKYDPDKNEIIAQPVGDPNLTFLATGKFTSPYSIQMKFSSDPKVQGELSANLYFSDPYWDGTWRGDWSNDLGIGDARVTISEGDSAYFSYGCQYVMGYH